VVIRTVVAAYAAAVRGWLFVAPQGERCHGNLAWALHSEVLKLYVAVQLGNRIGSPNPNLHFDTVGQSGGEI